MTLVHLSAKRPFVTVVLPTRHLLSLLRLGVEDPERPYYSRDELIAMLVDRDLDNQLRRAFAKSSAASELES
ncbi:hypothetical protein VEE68_44070 [Escherichia coli]|nr:hypothetical protein VEE68_44070 [Escherichia coli]